MASSGQPPTRPNFMKPPTPPRFRRYTTTLAPDTIDEILSTCLHWVLPVIFFCVIIVLVTMLTTYTLVMGRPLPRAFTFVIVMSFSLLITITFFTLVAFHIYRYQRVRSMLSEAHDPSCFCQSSNDVLQRAAAQGSSRAAHPHSSIIPSREISSSQAKKKLRQQDADTESHQHFKMAPAPPPSGSRHSSLVFGENGEQQSRSSTPSQQQQIPTIILPPPSPTFDDDGRRPRSHFFTPAPSAPEAPLPLPPKKDDPVYYLPPGPPCTTLPSTGSRPTWADDIEQRIAANLAASMPERRWNFWSKNIGPPPGLEKVCIKIK